MLLTIVLLGLLDLNDSVGRMLEQADPELPQGASGLLASMVKEARKEAGDGLLSFGIVVFLYSVYALARTLVESLNVAYEMRETRPAWRRLLLLVAFGPALIAATIAAAAAMLIGSHLAESIAGLIGLDEVVVVLWSWCASR